MSQLLTYISHNVVSTQEANCRLFGVIVALRFGHVVFCFLQKNVTGEVAVRSREDVDVLGSVQYHLLVCPAREQPEGTSFSS